MVPRVQPGLGIIPAEAGIHMVARICLEMDSRLRGNDTEVLEGAR